MYSRREKETLRSPCLTVAKAHVAFPNVKVVQSSPKSPSVRSMPPQPRQEVELVDPTAFHKHRFDYMGDISTVSTLLLQKESDYKRTCAHYVNPFSWLRRPDGVGINNCLAVVRASQPESAPIIRYKPKLKLDDPGADGHGFFTKVTIGRSRTKTALKFMPFVKNFDSMDRYVNARLASRNYHEKGIDTLVIMVVNAGELDLFLNLACSARKHGIPLDNFVVFAGGDSIIPTIESTGALGLYHRGFFSVSRHASHDYLDFTFVDMMWYKCFSIFLMLRSGYNIVFQDADLVWFRDPIPYFKKLLREDKDRHQGKDLRPLDALLSDDGQRSLRYTPFFANSGFYYMASNPEMINVAYGIMTAFPMIQRLGSQQNMFTMRLLEGMTNYGIRTQFLNITDFPNGYLYHHRKAYMKSFLEGREPQAFNFHMCWTQGKKDKLKYLKGSRMWYLSDQVERVLHDRIKPGTKISTTSWDELAGDVCHIDDKLM